MKYFELDTEEKNIIGDLDEFVSVSDIDKKRNLYQTYARNTLKKTRNINLRLSERDLHKIKAKAVERGLPYQTLAASVLHQYASN